MRKAILGLALLALAACDTERRIEYRVHGTSARARVTYQTPGIEVREEHVPLPFEWAADFESGTLAGIGAGIPGTGSSSNTLTCEIFEDGELVDTETDSGLFLSVGCAVEVD